MMRLVLSVALLLTAFSARSEDPKLLYWMVDQDAQDEQSFAFVTARVLAQKGGLSTPLELWDNEAQSPYEGSGGLVDSDVVSGGQGYKTDPEGDTWISYLDPSAGDWSGCSFVIELMNENGESYRTASKSYSLLKKENAIASDLNARPWTARAGDFHSVPEPTSGLMILLGVAALELRRKRILV